MIDYDEFSESYDVFYETLSTYDDPDDPESLSRFVNQMRDQVLSSAKNEYLSNDHIGIALYRMVRLRNNHFYSNLVDDGEIKDWGLIRNSIDVHKVVTPFIKSIELDRPSSVAIAVLCCLKYDLEN